MRFRYVPVRHFRTAGAHSEIILIHVFGLEKVTFRKDSYESEAQRMSSRDAIVFSTHGSHAVRRIDEEANSILTSSVTSTCLGVGG